MFSYNSLFIFTTKVKVVGNRLFMILRRQMKAKCSQSTYLLYVPQTWKELHGDNEGEKELE